MYIRDISELIYTYDIVKISNIVSTYSLLLKNSLNFLKNNKKNKFVSLSF